MIVFFPIQIYLFHLMIYTLHQIILQLKTTVNEEINNLF